MSRKPAKARAAGSKAFTSFGSSSFGAFSTTSSSANLSYLAEPPDFSSISDANVVVSLKNLLKKDATTKAKALEDLVTYVQARPYEQNGGTEEPILEAWVQMYPRISIDNSRRVRELSHVLQLELMKSARKRMERYVPKIVSSWLSGTFDRDRTVSRVATEGLASFLTTPEKVLQFWKRCQTQILDYASDTIKETPDTLSDGRSTSTDDAEAKYYRVLGSSLALVLNLLQKLGTSELEKSQDNYDSFFEHDKVWTSVTSNDAVVRRLSCQLLSICLEKRPDRIGADLARLSKIFIAEGLKCSQMDSAADYISALTKLTARHPTVWTSDYAGNKSPTSRLKSFLEKGSQGGTARFWGALGQLLDVVPTGVLPEDLDAALEFLRSIRLGVTRRDEPRGNAVEAWSTYLGTARYFVKTVQSDDARVKIVEDGIFPLTANYLYPTPETSSWTSAGQLPVLIKAYTSTTVSPYGKVVEATKSQWILWKNEFKDRIRNSLPEASKDHEKSQTSVAEEGYRWFALTGKILDAHERTVATDRPIPNIPAEPSLELLQEIFELLEARNWKPFGAASTVESAFKQAPALFRLSPAADSEVFSFLASLLPRGGGDFLQSSASPYIFSSITLLSEITGQQQEYERIWKANIAALLKHIENPNSLRALTTLISTKHATPLARQDQVLQVELVKRCLMCAVGTVSLEWDLFDAVVTFDTLTEPAGGRLVKELGIRVLDSSGQPNHGVIKGLELVAEKKPALLLQDEDTHMSLMANLLSLSERSDASSDIVTLKALIESPSNSASRMLVLVQQSINNADPNSLAIDTIVQQAMQVQDSIVSSTGYTERIGQLECLIPDTSIWKKELDLFLNETPDPSLALTSVLGGSYFLPTSASTIADASARRDRSGCSIPGRMAMYTTELLSSGFQFNDLPFSKQVEIIVYLSLTVELAADQLTVLSENKLWNTLSSAPAMSDAGDLISSARKLINGMTEDANDWRDDHRNDHSRLMHDVVETLMEEAKPLTPMGLYCARALSELLQALTEKHGFPSSGEQWLANLNILKNEQTAVLPAVAVLSGLGETISASRVVSNFCNRLVSDIAGASIHQEKTLVTLVLLDTCMQIYDIGELPVANNRLVFAVKQVTSWLETPEDLDYRFAAETCRCLQRLLPCIKDVYGTYWERAIDFCIYLWTEQMIQSLDCRLPGIHASLRLIAILQSLEDPNDDLTDVLQSTAERRSAGLIELLKIPREKESQPLEIVDSIISRQVEKIPLDHVKDLSELYGLVASGSRAIQTAAFTLLHKAFPAAQENLSVDVLLEKRVVQLPEELLSLLLDAPTLEAYPDEVLALFPTTIRSYLLSWHLVFDAFKAVSFKVRSDYAEHLKAANYIRPLLDFTFDVLGHSAAHPLNPDKASFTKYHIRNYDMKLAEAETEERNMQWLLIHLYYLVLKYVPGLFRTWYIDCRSKQTKIAVEGWMTKYFSPIIISEALKDVENWKETQEASADDEIEFFVKVSQAAREVVAGYVVDELQASIAIRIPPEFPLEGVSVVGINRVAVSEKKWQSWIMTTQGVITFSGGSIIDGLTTFRRNVVGAMKGQTECAICYSIISSDKKTPDKRCQTCKNLFHRICLYKWFQSSNQNTCPLCRNPIDYLGADTRARRGGA
ncbi:hypothetical protein F4779DRAFT_575304 [Xylariaceae sp. FL0662B]|nr:hypothetical protein F4779DRAFT_575304 [Xylariaceae sp. FL0662B]